MIYTSYFAKQKYNKSENLYAITYYKPPFFKGKYLECVAPSGDLVQNYKKGLIGQKKYQTLYIKYLEQHKEEIVKEIETLPDGSILLCYEGPGKFCHRHVLAECLRSWGYECEEI